MARIKNVKKIIAEDFPAEDRAMISRLGFVLNEFMTQTVNAVNGNLDFENLTQNIVTFTIQADANGTPIGNDAVNVGKLNPRGLQVIRAVNQTNTALAPENQPFISYSPSGNNLISISNITGLQANNTYELTVIVY